ncbi:hypothetical protein H8356DRAFT_948975 [Neocallimastix lanati (nom. inval.)]|uniref:Uncharacterized protein n=1 Tax=Neocallimastix californiae TaxID=1754190 RepID=A0A1Y2C1H4_9FUNG|nr:hypothetical protein H8356DRAFT_948975 [Neocallimastix sp. JGI-2020a]ORY40892.1 hypothetical protein LY90DRAFT_510350 [Neocallimastix californiae]|eukprot:ORY40892.1 hypothetical protein LY90DRAFT_510350 [Neocallimastix californiae]
MERIILNERNYRIWRNFIMEKLEDANLDHTIVLYDNTTKKIERSSLNVKTISEKGDSKARRMIYKHLSEETWAYYCETEKEETTTLNKEIPTGETITRNREIPSDETTILLPKDNDDNAKSTTGQKKIHTSKNQNILKI